jgi:hypothetical protein
LPVRQTQTGAFVELASDALENRFKTGRCRHVTWCGEQNARSRGAHSPSG